MGEGGLVRSLTVHPAGVQDAAHTWHQTRCGWHEQRQTRLPTRARPASAFLHAMHVWEASSGTKTYPCKRTLSRKRLHSSTKLS